MSESNLSSGLDPILSAQQPSELLAQAEAADALTEDLIEKTEEAATTATPEEGAPSAKPEEAQASISEEKLDAPAQEAQAVSAQEAPNSPEEDAQAFCFEDAKKELLALQQQIRALGIPVVILLEGWSAAGKGTMAGELLSGLDPRGYEVYVCERMSKDENQYPDMHRYWTRMPASGEISLFIGSWYHALCVDCLEGKQARRKLAASLERINLMERALVADGTLVLKFFINISRKEQKRRLRELSGKKSTCGLVSKADDAQNERYDKWQKLYNQALSATNEDGAVWHILRGASKNECREQLYRIVTEAFSRAISERRSGARPWDTPVFSEHEALPTAAIPPLRSFDPQQTLAVNYKHVLDEAQERLHHLQLELYRRSIPMVLAFEGWDAAGKGGAIRRLTSALDPRGCTVVPIAAPTALEKAHHHLWRFWTALPAKGNIAIFDRTWYGRVMVERIEGFCTEPQWQRAYEEINLFERELTQSGCIVRKFWLHIDQDEQLRRFLARRDDPQKAWKITDEDWRNREKWAQYEQAVDEMLQKTNTHAAPWVVVEANIKQYARIQILNSVIAAIEERLKEK